MKQNFFDELDKDWGEVLVDTYKEHNEIPFYEDKNKKLKIFLNESSLDIDNLSDGAYTETYKDKYNSEYKIVIYTYIYYKFSKMDLSIGISIYNLEKTLRTISYMQIRSIINNQQTYIWASNETISYDKSFLAKYIDRCSSTLNKNLEANNRELITQEYITKIKNLINE